jgi:phosphate transport system substrate-binding protein
VKLKTLALTTSLIAASITFTNAADARDQIRIVGSSTVYPFTTAVAEQFGQKTGMKTPVVESTGTGGGMKLFCAGVGADHPDATNASRRMKKGEWETCNKSGVSDIVEILVGFDGLTLAHSKASQPLQLTRGQLFLALAKEVPDASGKLVANPYKMWNEVDPSLPAKKIEILGPPPTSGTRDSLHELIMEKGAEQIEDLKALKEKDAKVFEKVWKSIREDGAYVEAGENDNVIVQKLEANPDAFGIFGYANLEQNVSKLQGVALDGVVPSYESIASGEYKPSRELFVYIKKAHLDVVPGLDKFALEYVSEAATGEEGYLGEKGLVPLPRDRHEQVSNAVAALQSMKGDELK